MKNNKKNNKLAFTLLLVGFIAIVACAIPSTMWVYKNMPYMRMMHENAVWYLGILVAAIVMIVGGSLLK